MKKRKKKKFLIRRIIAIVIIGFIILCLRNLICKIYEKEQSKQIRLLFNNQFVNLSDNIYVENSVIYLSEEDIKNIFDSTIYYNIGDKELITTYNKHVAVMHLNKNEMIVNDSIIQTQGQLKEMDSKIYLPLTDLEIVYDVETHYAENTNKIIVNSTTKSKKRVIVLDNTTVKARKGLFAFTLEKVDRGDYLYVLEENGRYKKVRTDSRKHRICKEKKSF